MERDTVDVCAPLISHVVIVLTNPCFDFSPIVSDLLSLRITLREERNGNDDDPVIGRVRIPILGLPDASKSKELLVKFSSDNPKYDAAVDAPAVII